MQLAKKRKYIKRWRSGVEPVVELVCILLPKIIEMYPRNLELGRAKILLVSLRYRHTHVHTCINTDLSAAKLTLNTIFHECLRYELQHW